MSILNPSVSVSAQFAGRSDATQNLAGGLAFRMSAAERVVTRMLSTFALSDSYYESASESVTAFVADLTEVASVDPEFLLRLAAFARQEMQMRAFPVMCLVECAAIPACKPFVRKWTPQILRRADEPGAAIAWWVKRHGDIGARGAKGGEHAFPNSLKKGIAAALDRFDEYHVAKYDSKGGVTLRDAVRLSFPSSKAPERFALWKYVLDGSIDAEKLPLLAARHALLQCATLDADALLLAERASATWEVLVSKFGSSKETWNAVRFPFMAGLRNLRNFLEKGADDALDRTIAMLCDESQVRRSKQLPFRFFSAYREVSRLSSPRVSEVLEALNVALELSLTNVPRLSGTTFVTCDNSGSMDNMLSDRSQVSLKQVGNLMGAMVHRTCERSIVSVFGTNHAVVPLLRQDSVITNMERLSGTDVGGSTAAWKTLHWLSETKTRVDRIILLSDMQCYGGDTPVWDSEPRRLLAEELHRYRSSVNPQCFLHSVDLTGYGTLQFPGDDRRSFLLAGWSERLLKTIPSLEQGTDSMLSVIRAWSPFAQTAPQTAVEEEPEGLGLARLGESFSETRTLFFIHIYSYRKIECLSPK